jgi:hypothetical protein
MKPTCERCHHEPSARHIAWPRPLWLCWACFDAWRKWYLGAAYKYVVPVETLKKLHAHMEARP